MSEMLEVARNLFVAVIFQAIADVKSDPQGKTVDGEKAYGWFWSESFRWWCDFVAWEHDDYKFREIRSKIKQIRDGVPDVYLSHLGKSMKVGYKRDKETMTRHYKHPRYSSAK